MCTSLGKKNLASYLIDTNFQTWSGEFASTFNVAHSLPICNYNIGAPEIYVYVYMFLDLIQWSVHKLPKA